MKNKLRNLSGFKQGPAQSMSASKYDAYSREEHKTMFPNLKFTYGGAFGSVKSVTEKTDWEKAGKPVVGETDWQKNVGNNIEEWRATADAKTAEKNTNRISGIVKTGTDLGAVQIDPEEIKSLWEFYNRDDTTAVSHIKPAGINLNVGDSSLPPVHIQNTPVVKNAKAKKSITPPHYRFTERSRREQTYNRQK